MVALRQVQIALYKGIGRQRRRGFGALPQVFGRTANPFLHKYIVPAAERLAADLFELAAPEIAVVVSGRKSFRRIVKSVGTQTLRKQMGSGNRKRSASRVIPTKSAKQTSRSREDIYYKHFSIFMSSSFLYQPFVAVSGNPGENVPVVDNVLLSHEKEMHASTSLEENCVESEFQTDRNYYVDLRQTYLAVKLNFEKGRSFKT